MKWNDEFFFSLLTCNFYYKKYIHVRILIIYPLFFLLFYDRQLNSSFPFPPFLVKKNIIAILLKKERKYDTLYVFVENKFDIEERSVHAASLPGLVNGRRRVVVLAVASVQRTVIENCSLTLDFVVSARSLSTTRHDEKSQRSGKGAGSRKISGEPH